MERGRIVFVGCVGCGKLGDDWLYVGVEFECIVVDVVCDDGVDVYWGFVWWFGVFVVREIYWFGLLVRRIRGIGSGLWLVDEMWW